MKQIISFKKEVAFKTMVGEITSISLEHTLHFSSDSSIEGDLIINGTYKMTEASALEETFNYAIPVDIMLTNDLEEKDRNVTIDNFVYRIVNEEILELEVDVLVKGLEKVEIVEEEENEEVVELLEPEPVREEKVEEVEPIVQEVVKEPILEEKETEEIEEAVIETKIEDERADKLEGEEEIAKSQAKIEAIGSNKEEVMINQIPEVLEEKKEEVINSPKEAEEVPVMNSIFSAFANTKETYTTYSIYILREEDTIEDILNRYQITREELGLYNQLDNLNVGSKLIIPTTINA